MLTTVRGVGVLISLTFVSAIDDPSRFRSSRSLGAHLGLTKRKYQPAQTDVTGRISKCGDQEVRTALYEATNIILARPVKGSQLKSWAAKIAGLAGMEMAKVALARKLAVVTHRILCNSYGTGSKVCRQAVRMDFFPNGKISARLTKEVVAR